MILIDNLLLIFVQSLLLLSNVLLLGAQKLEHLGRDRNLASAVRVFRELLDDLHVQLLGIEEGGTLFLLGIKNYLAHDASVWLCGCHGKLLSPMLIVLLGRRDRAHHHVGLHGGDAVRLSSAFNKLVKHDEVRWRVIL